MIATAFVLAAAMLGQVCTKSCAPGRPCYILMTTTTGQTHQLRVDRPPGRVAAENDDWIVASVGAHTRALFPERRAAVPGRAAGCPSPRRIGARRVGGATTGGPLAGKPLRQWCWSNTPWGSPAPVIMDPDSWPPCRLCLNPPPALRKFRADFDALACPQP